MHHRAVDITGLRVGYLTALKYHGSDGRKCRQTLSAKLTGHGMSKHPAYAVWRPMLARCGTPSHPAFKNYGARGITVCARWRKSFENFWEDMGPTYRRGLTLERTNNARGYSPANC